MVKLSPTELVMEIRSGDPKVYRRAVRLTEGRKNDSEIRAALLLYKASALRELRHDLRSDQAEFEANGFDAAICK